MKLTVSEDGIRAELEREADRTRERLMHRLDVLDKRRHELFDIRVQLKKHADQIKFGGAAVLSMAVAVTALRFYAAQRRREKIREERWLALRRLWTHPERVAQRRRSLATTVALNVAVAVTTFIAAEGGWRLVEGKRRLPRAPSPPVEAFGV